MRILHTSDWHIGRTFHGHSTLDALRGVLDALVAQVRDQGVDVVIVAGDVFDSATPAAACYGVLSDTLAALADAGAEVIVTSGNHDSAARLGFQSALLRPGIHVLTDPGEVGTPITVRDEHGPVHVYGIPFLEPALLRHEWPGVRSQASALAHAMDLVRADLSERASEGPVRAVAAAVGRATRLVQGRGGLVPLLVVVVGHLVGDARVVVGALHGGPFRDRSSPL